MENKAVSEEDRFFNDNQNKVKADIISKLLENIYFTVEENIHLFPDEQSRLDLIASVLVLFTSELLVGFIKSHNREENKDVLINTFSSEITNEVNKKLLKFRKDTH